MTHGSTHSAEPVSPVAGRIAPASGAAAAELLRDIAATSRGWRRAVSQRAIAYYVYRHRFLALFTLIGLASILIELAVLQYLPASWAWELRVAAAFFAGLALSLVLNVTLNFHVPRQYLLRTSAWFVGISIASFAATKARW